MSRHGGLLSWTAMVSTHMPHLSQPQARVLALWSYGIAMTRSCGRLTVATFLALLLGQKVATVEQRLYEGPNPNGIKITATHCYTEGCERLHGAYLRTIWTTLERIPRCHVSVHLAGRLPGYMLRDS